MSTNHQNKEEVELGALFIIIGRGFRNFFNFIWKILKGIFHFVILVLLFVRENIIKLGIALLIGGAYGGFLEFVSKPTYGADLVLQPNFKSSIQLYNNVNYYNELIIQEEYDKLGAIFNINSEKASSIVSFEVTPIKTNNDILESYNELVTSIDTAAIRSYTFLDFKKAFTDYDYKRHKVHVEAESNTVFGNLGEVIISSIEENEYYKRLKTFKRKDLYRSDSILKQNLKDVDSLRKVYNRVMLEEAKKESSGTNIDLALGEGEQKSTKELELFRTSRDINYQLNLITEEVSEKSEVVNVISNFQSVGYEIKGITNNQIAIKGLMGFIIMTFVILLSKLNKYLESYKNR